MYHHRQNDSYNQNDDAYRRRRRRNPSYYDQNDAYAYRHRNPSYYDQNYAYRHRNPSYYDQNYAYRHRNPSYYDQSYAYHRRRHHQHQHHHHHQNRSYDQIPHHHHQQQQQQKPFFYDHDLSYNDHRRQIEAWPTSARLVKKPKEAPVVDFPVDDVLIPILARLPAKTLLKFRCVCKSWNSLIQQDHHFLSLHQLHLNHDGNKNSSPLVTFRCEGSYVILNYSSASSPYEIEFNRSEVDRPQCITNSCNGLLGLYNSCTFFIVNPTIRKLRPLPMPTPSYVGTRKAGLGFDASSGVYKVVRIFNRKREERMIKPSRLGCEVYYLGGSGGWKPIDDDPPVQPSLASLPVVVDGAILWASDTFWKEHREVFALSFDLREEKFSVIMHPEGGSSRRMFSQSHVFASGGCICVAEESTSVHMNIWLLMKDDKKNNSNKWVKQYVIDFTHVLTQISPPFFGELQPLTTDHNGRIVISWERGRKFYYDPRTGSFDKHELDAIHADVHHAAPYTKSMVWPWLTHCGVQ